MSVSKSGYYDWHKRPANVISLETLKLYRLVRQLFKQSRGSLGNREMVKKLRKDNGMDPSTLNRPRNGPRCSR